MRILLRNKIYFLFLALSFSLGLSCSAYDCTIGREVCSCEQVDCNNFKKILEYCEKDDYREETCGKSDIYDYTEAFCNLTSAQSIKILAQSKKVIKKPVRKLKMFKFFHRLFNV
jgi:hypothetical protein